LVGYPTRAGAQPVTVAHAGSHRCQVHGPWLASTLTVGYAEGNLARRALAVLRDEGFASFGFKVASTLGYRRLMLLERPLEGTPPRLACGLALGIELLAPRDVDDYLAFRPESARERILDRLRAGQACFVARHEGSVVSACWATTQPAWSEYLACEIAVAAGEVFMFDAFTQSEYRGRGIAPALCAQQLIHYAQAGLCRATRAVLPENVPAWRAHAKAGFRPYAVIRTLRIGPWQRRFGGPCKGADR
jgi:ribosomal protein S18 acetylase RimI-like enzyme